MITEQEKQAIIDAAVEKVLLSLPEVIGNLINNQLTLNKINKDFYDKYPELRKHKAIVADVVESVEGINTLESYGAILMKSVPEIRKRIGSVKDLDLVSEPLSKPSLDFSNGEF